MNPTCETCSWFRENSCRRKAPDIQSIPISQTMYLGSDTKTVIVWHKQACWPPVHPYDFCGEHKPREEKPLSKILGD